ncbi:alpha/beta fold hydrolase [Pseudomonas sp. SDO524_S393]
MSFRAKGYLGVLLAFLVGAGEACAASSGAAQARMAYRDVVVDGVKIAYREIGDPEAPAVLLLHGVPSSSRMYDALMRRLGGRFHLIAPDYPGFGNSDAPAPGQFSYTFDHYAQLMAHFTDAVGVKRYALFMQDYGAPVGMRLAMARPQAITAMIFQNGNVYSEGLGKMWETRKAYWENRAAHEAAIQTAHLSVELTRARHIGTDPDVSAYDPDLWHDEVAFLNRPGEAAIQMELIYDYRTNIAAYPAWQAWLRSHAPRTLVLWGKYDPAFIVEGAQAFKRDLPTASIVILDAGHFAMDTRLDEVVERTASFLGKQ